MLRFRNDQTSGKNRRPAAPRATVEPMEGRVLMSGTTVGSPVTFTYVVTNPSPLSADSVAAESSTDLTPDGRRLVIAYKGGLDA